MKKAFEVGLKAQATVHRPDGARRNAGPWKQRNPTSRNLATIPASAVVRRLDPIARTSRWSAISWNGSISTRSCQRSPAGAAGRIARRKIDWPLFPGYCFARFDPADTLPILKCTGVVNIVSFDGKPAPIPEYELDSIRVLVGSELQFDPCPMIHEGMMVAVIHGPLQGVIGRLMRKDAPSARLVLSVDLDRPGGERSKSTQRAT